MAAETRQDQIDVMVDKLRDQARDTTEEYNGISVYRGGKADPDEWEFTVSMPDGDVGQLTPGEVAEQIIDWPKEAFNRSPEHMRLTKVEAEQLVRFVSENHERISEGIIVDRLTSGDLRVRRVGEGAVLLTEAVKVR